MILVNNKRLLLMIISFNHFGYNNKLLVYQIKNDIVLMVRDQGKLIMLCRSPDKLGDQLIRGG